MSHDSHKSIIFIGHKFYSFMSTNGISRIVFLKKFIILFSFLVSFQHWFVPTM